MLKPFKSETLVYEKGDMITVVLPQFIVKSWWQKNAEIVEV